MGLCFDFVNYAFHATVFINNKRHPMNPVVLSSHELLGTPNTKSVNDCFILIGQEREREVILC